MYSGKLKKKYQDQDVIQFIKDYAETNQLNYILHTNNMIQVEFPMESDGFYFSLNCNNKLNHCANTTYLAE